MRLLTHKSYPVSRSVRNIKHPLRRRFGNLFTGLTKSICAGVAIGVLSLIPYPAWGQTTAPGTTGGMAGALKQSLTVRESREMIHSLIRWLRTRGYEEVDASTQGIYMVYSYVRSRTGSTLELKTYEAPESIELGIKTTDDALHATLRAIISNLTIVKASALPIPIRMGAVQRLAQLGYKSLLVDLVIREESDIASAAISALEELRAVQHLRHCIEITSTIMHALNDLIETRANPLPFPPWTTSDYLLDIDFLPPSIYEREPPKLTPLDVTALRSEVVRFLDLTPQLTAAIARLSQSR